jgi:hypothetical protein
MVFQTEWATMPAGQKPYMLTLALGPLMTLFLFIVRLDIRISSEKFEYKVFPWRNKYKSIPFSKVAQIELIKPKGIKSFKGVGTHQDFKQTELNFGGKYKVTLRMTHGRVLSFSTNKPQELKSFLQSLPEGGPVIKIEI